MPNDVILFGGTSNERLVATASAQHFSEVLPDAECWFWREDGTVCQVEPNELQSHQDVFLKPFQPSETVRTWQSLGQALDAAQTSDSVVLLSLHGGDGENGTVQRQCESRKLAFTGSGSAASETALDKRLAKERAKTRGIKLAEQITFKVSDPQAQHDLASFQRQYSCVVIKPALEGSSVGLSFIQQESQVAEWWKANASSPVQWLCEEMLIGREFTIGVCQHEGSLLALPPSEVILERNARFDYAGKYLGVGNREITPADISPKLTTMVQEVVLLAHTAIGCYGYTRSEVIMTDRGVYYLETNTLPGFTKKSFIPQQLHAAQISPEAFVRYQIEVAKKRYI